MSGANKNVGDLVRSSRAKSAGVVRIQYTFSFSNQRQRRRQTGGDSIDVPADASVGDVRAMIRASIIEWWESHYEARGDGTGTGRVPIGDINVKSIEGI